MKNVIEILEKQYQSFIDQKRDWSFFLGLVDYIKFTNETPELHLLLEKTKESKSKQIKTIYKLEKEAVAELLKIKRELLQIIKNEKMAQQGLPGALSKLEDYEKGKIDPNHYKSSRLNEGLRELIKVLSGSEKEFTKNYPRYGLSKKLLTRMAESSELHEKKETELWGAYEKLQLVFRIIHSGEKYLNTLEKDPDRYDEYLGLLEEMEIIKNDGERPFFSSLPSPKKEEDPVFNRRKKKLKKDNYKLYATRINNYLIQELSKEESEKINHKRTDYKISFDKSRGILIIGSEEVKIKKFSNQYYMLEIIFKDKESKNTDWQFSEIAELMDFAKNIQWKKLYNTADALKKKIAIDTGIKDFFITTTQSIKINEKYLKKS